MFVVSRARVVRLRGGGGLLGRAMGGELRSCGGRV